MITHGSLLLNPNFIRVSEDVGLFIHSKIFLNKIHNTAQEIYTTLTVMTHKIIKIYSLNHAQVILVNN